MSKAMERARDFVAVWIRTETNDETAAQLNMKVSAVTAYAVTLRKRGVNLPNHAKQNGRTLTSLDVAQLNSIINKETGKKGKL